MSFSTQYLRTLLIKHELMLLLLVAATGALGGIWAYFWQTSSAEAVRLNKLLFTALQIRGDLFHQVKEVTLARLVEDPEAVPLYKRYTRRINGYFNHLRRNTANPEEEFLVQRLQVAYRVIQKDMNNIFRDPYAISRVGRVKIVDPRYEQDLVGQFEQAFEALHGALTAEHAEIDAWVRRWTGPAMFILPIPVLLAIIMLIISRRNLYRGFVRPVGELMNGAKKIRDGRLDHRITPAGVREMVELGVAVNEMASELRKSRDALIEKEKQAALGALVPVVAHNIRNPLASIRASVQMLDETDSAREIADTKTAVIETVDRLGRWVNALVTYLHPLQPRLVEADLGEVLAATLHLLQSRLRQKKITVERNWRAQLPVRVDVDLMEQALYGLLSNAVDASPIQGKIIVEARRSEREIELNIIDQGPGMPFSPESSDLQPGPSTKRYGTGLGIPIAFKICKVHGWRLSYGRHSPAGTRVSICAPSAAEAEAQVE